MFLLSCLVRRPTVDASDRAAPRVRIRPLHRVEFLHLSDDGADTVPVVNLSVTGMGVIRDPQHRWPAPGGAVAGRLVVGTRDHELCARVVHHTGDIVGCAFTEPPREIAVSIHEHLGAELAAAGLEAVPEGELAAPADGTPHVFRGPNNCMLHFIERGGRVVRFSLAFLGHYLEGGERRPVRFGFVTRDGEVTGGGDGDPVLWADMINAELLAATIRFVSAIPHLSPQQRDGVLHYIY